MTPADWLLEKAINAAGEGIELGVKTLFVVDQMAQSLPLVSSLRDRALDTLFKPREPLDGGSL